MEYLYDNMCFVAIMVFSAITSIGLLIVIFTGGFDHGCRETPPPVPFHKISGARSNKKDTDT